jgi:FtsH-binding integral membrane protein
MATASLPLQQRNEKVAWLGLWLAITGLVLPVFVAIVCALVSDKEVGMLCLLLFVALEVAALGCAIATRRQQPGKAALAISVISLLLVGIALGLFMPWRDSTTPGGASPQVVAE